MNRMRSFYGSRSQMSDDIHVRGLGRRRQFSVHPILFRYETHNKKREHLSTAY